MHIDERGAGKKIGVPLAFQLRVKKPQRTCLSSGASLPPYNKVHENSLRIRLTISQGPCILRNKLSLQRADDNS